MTSAQLATYNDLVWVASDRLSGAPCFGDTRVPVQALIDHLEANVPLGEFLEGFPSVTRDQAIRFTELAKQTHL